MEILLCENEEFKAESHPSCDTFLTMEVPHSFGPVKRNRYPEIIQMLKRTFSNNQVCIHLKTTGWEYDCMVRIHGFLAKKLDPISVPGLRLRLQLSFISTAPSFLKNNWPKQLCTEIPMFPMNVGKSENMEEDVEDCLENDLFLEAKEVSFDWDSLFDKKCKNAVVRGTATMSVLFDLPISTASLEEKKIYKKILTSKIHFDMVIIASDGTIFECNKAFLAAQSPVLATMLEVEMSESLTSQIKIEDMSTDGIKALLSYIYTFDLRKAMDCSEIALELLRAGHKYDIKTLGDRVAAIFKGKLESWFTVNSAFSLFMFTRQVDDMKELKLKAAAVLKTKRNSFRQCPAYEKENEENPAQIDDAVWELFHLFSRK